MIQRDGTVDRLKSEINAAVADITNEPNDIVRNKTNLATVSWFLLELTPSWFAFLTQGVHDNIAGFFHLCEDVAHLKVVQRHHGKWYE